jgi:two-component sensor histidine kinase
LLKEVHHRVKNNLQIISSLLNIQASKSNNQEVIEELNESKQRILSIALTHEFIYKSGTLAYIQMPDYLEQLIEQLKYLFNSEKNRINVFLNIEMVAFEMDVALPIGLMVNEIVSNSFKHAFDSEGGEIHVQMTRNETQFCLTLSDNGKGFDPSKRNEIESNHIGLELIDSLVDQINGNINMHNVKGTTFEIFFNSSRFK